MKKLTGINHKMVFIGLLFLAVVLSCNKSKSHKQKNKAVALKPVKNNKAIVTKQLKNEPQPKIQPNKPQTYFTITFETDETGKTPPGWSSYFTGRGNPGKWEILEDDGNKVLTQISQKNPGYHFDVIVLSKSDYQNLEISVKFKGVKGKEDQGGGPVWRYLDENNYYIARANPLENNFRIYKVVDGNRIQLASYDVFIPSREWHTIKVKMAGDHIECFYDNKKYLDVTDNTFTKSGKVGLWTKADAFTSFDDFKIIVP